MADNTPPSPNTNSETSQEKIAKRVSTIVLTGTCTLGALGMAMAIVDLVRGGSESINILQILFSAILPLFGTWIGTILAYYFSKENLMAANQTVQHLVNSITSDKKLETTKAKDVMITLDKLKYVLYKSGADDKINLKTDFLDFLKKENIQRVILLDENKVAKYVIHKSIIEGFIAEKYFSQEGTDPDNQDNPQPGDDQPTGTPTAKELTFADLKASSDPMIKDILENGIKFINENANLSDAKTLIKNFKACNDVFITKNGNPDEPILGWITNKTIADHSVV